jgi:hypothetical protein
MSPQLGLRRVAHVRARIGEFLEAGIVPEGVRRVIPLAGGTVEGPEIRGEVLPLGADWNLVRADGSESVSARYVIRTDDGVLLSVLNEGVIADTPDGRLGLTRLRIEAPVESRYADLNDAVLVGSLTVEEDASGVVVVLEYWRVVAA